MLNRDETKVEPIFPIFLHLDIIVVAFFFIQYLAQLGNLFEYRKDD